MVEASGAGAAVAGGDVVAMEVVPAPLTAVSCFKFAFYSAYRYCCTVLKNIHGQICTGSWAPQT